MSRLSVGDVMPNFLYATPFRSELSLEDTVRQVNGKTAIVFLRYFGCTLCQLDLHTYAGAYDKITKNGGQLLVVLQSDPEGLAQQITPESFPYEIICDPEKKLYNELSVGSAPSMLRMMSPGMVLKGIKATAKGYKHGAYEGDELQLPAVFVMTPDRCLTHVHYGRDAGDVATAKELAALLS